MKIMTKKEVEVISDIRCDVCEESCQTEGAGFDPIGPDTFSRLGL